MPSTASTPSKARTGEQDLTRVIDTDVRLFWRVVDDAAPAALAARLERDYLDAGSDALRDFIPGRIVSAARLADAVTTQRARYEGVRQATLAASAAEPAIRAVFRAMRSLYADAVLPDVYFVIGRFNTGGTSSAHGILIGAEMYPSHDALPHIVAHELAHAQQRPLPSSTRRTLLAQSIIEGSADFVAELISGAHVNPAAHAYGRTHEAELWADFTRVMHGTDVSDWLYRDPPGERPPDLGYFIGYRIAEAYYVRAADKAAALRVIFTIEDPDGFLSASGYTGSRPGG
jgi:hypothetical protein